MGFGQHQSMIMTQRLMISLPPTNWSLLDAFGDEGDTPLRLKKIQLDVSGMSLEERLHTVDSANKIFRFAYTQAKSEDGELKGRYYKIPLMRDFNFKIDIKIKISRG